MTSFDYSEVFATIAGLIAIIPVVVQWFKKLIPDAGSLSVQVFSWAIGIVIALAGYWFNLGFLADLEWYYALLAGFLASLGANGVFDTGLITWIFGLFTAKK